MAHEIKKLREEQMRTHGL
ncbi:hypothetical protein Tco_1098391, partial [Tanacetum coccineum]